MGEIWSGLLHGEITVVISQLWICFPGQLETLSVDTLLIPIWNRSEGMLLTRPLILSSVPLKDHLITIQLQCCRLAVSPVGETEQKFEMAEEARMLLVSLLIAAAVTVIQNTRQWKMEDALQETPRSKVQTLEGAVSLQLLQPGWALSWLALAAPLKEICPGVHAKLPISSHAPSLCKLGREKLSS